MTPAADAVGYASVQKRPLPAAGAVVLKVVLQPVELVQAAAVAAEEADSSSSSSGGSSSSSRGHVQDQQQEQHGSNGTADVGPDAQAAAGSGAAASQGVASGNRVTVGKGNGVVELVLLQATVTAWQDEDSVALWQAQGAMVPSAHPGLKATIRLGS